MNEECERVYVIEHKEHFDQPWVSRSYGMPLEDAYLAFEVAELTTTVPVRLVSFPAVGRGPMRIEVH